ncbi:MAG: LacI family DNA-binding transcriptional regulator [Cytophagales bacterium]|nr:LacI family DNA-binding transcriptional regulator [Cytophagales bacterium]
MKRNITIKDIAKELGVAPSTVSRALKDHPEINVETKKKVHALAKEWNYEPNAIALSLRNQKTNTIGVILPEFVHFFFSTVISGVEDVAYSKGYQVFVTQSNEDYEKEVLDCKAMYNVRADGFLICPSKNTYQFDHIRALIDRSAPVVLFDRNVKELGCSYVSVDDIAGGYEATKHLIEKGCKTIGYIGGHENLINVKERHTGYLKALEEAGLPLKEDLVVTVDYPVDSDEKVKLLQELIRKKPDGIFVHNDMVAIELLKEAKEMGVKVPEDLKVIGFSNWFFTRHTTPSLSTMEQRGFEIGREAALLLFDEIMSNKGEHGFVEPKHVLVQPELIERDSSK